MIGDALSASHITWHYYGDGFSSQLLYSHYCDICNPFQFSRSITRASKAVLRLR
jgi:hypothetical protein